MLKRRKGIVTDRRIWDDFLIAVVCYFFISIYRDDTILSGSQKWDYK